MIKKDSFLSSKDKELWNAYTNAWRNSLEVGYDLRRNATDLTGVLIYGLSGPIKGPALDLIKMFDSEALKPYMGALLDCASHQNGAELFCEELLLKIPKQWLIDNIEHEAEILLSEIGDCEQYSHLLHIFEEIDYSLAVRHAKKALAHSDPEIREIGEDFLKRTVPTGYNADNEGT